MGAGSPWLLAAVAATALYEVCWIRYLGPRTPADLYRPLAGIPVPLASLPVAGCLLLGIHGRLAPLVLGAVVMGIGHIGIHARHARTLTT